VKIGKVYGRVKSRKVCNDYCIERAKIRKFFLEWKVLQGDKKKAIKTNTLITDRTLRVLKKEGRTAAGGL
jgi:hypothetical protein